MRLASSDTALASFGQPEGGVVEPVVAVVPSGAVAVVPPGAVAVVPSGAVAPAPAPELVAAAASIAAPALVASVEPAGVVWTATAVVIELDCRATSYRHTVQNQGKVAEESTHKAVAAVEYIGAPLPSLQKRNSLSVLVLVPGVALMVLLLQMLKSAPQC